MKPHIWLRILAGVQTFFTIGHTLGAWPRVTRGAQEAALFQAMQDYTFPIMGFTRSYWDFYRGFDVSISVQLAMFAMIAWQVATIAKHDPRRALPMAITMQVGSIGLLVVSWLFFFGGPIVTSLISVAVSTMAVVALVKAARRVDGGAHVVSTTQPRAAQGAAVS
jgi:hypothetical protein